MESTNANIEEDTTTYYSARASTTDSFLTGPMPKDFRSGCLMKRALNGNMLTVSAMKSPEYYLKLIRYHFMQNSDNLCLQSLGLSTPNLVHVACLIKLKGYARQKKIKNDHITIPVID